MYPITVDGFIAPEGLLVEHTLKGDLDAFNQLVLLYQDIAYNVAYRILGEHTASEDAVQEAFISAYFNISQFHSGSFKAWLLRIVINECYDELRIQKRKPTLPLQFMDQSGEEIQSSRWLMDPGDTPEDIALRTEQNTAIQRCLNLLAVEFRTVIVLVDIMGLTYSEVGETLDIALGTVKSRLGRARAKLRFYLVRCGEIIEKESAW